MYKLISSSITLRLSGMRYGREHVFIEIPHQLIHRNPLRLSPIPTLLCNQHSFNLGHASQKPLYVKYMVRTDYRY